MKADGFFGILIPFIGTTAGAACVVLMKKESGRTVQRALTGFSSGVMTPATKRNPCKIPLFQFWEGEFSLNPLTADQRCGTICMN